MQTYTFSFKIICTQHTYMSHFMTMEFARLFGAWGNDNDFPLQYNVTFAD